MPPPRAIAILLGLLVAPLGCNCGGTAVAPAGAGRPGAGDEGSSAAGEQGSSAATQGAAEAPQGGEGEGAPASSTAAAAPRTGPQNVLWLGNSLVRYTADGPYPAYDIPRLVEGMRAAAEAEGRPVGPPLEERVLAQDGTGLAGWWSSWFGYAGPDGESVSAARAIVEDPRAARHYDPRLGYVSLPPGTGGWDRIICLSVVNYVDEDQWYEGQAFVPEIERWYAFIRAQDPSPEILHYVAPADSRKIARKQRLIDALYADLAERYGGRIVPVGRAFHDAMATRRDLELRRPERNDFLHYSGAGAYLAASVFYAVLHGDPEGLPAPAELGLSAADALFLQRTAKATVDWAATARH